MLYVFYSVWEFVKEGMETIKKLLHHIIFPKKIYY